MDVRGEIYHVLNRANFRSRLFKTPAHYQDFLAIVEEGLTFVPMGILAYRLMPNQLNESQGKEEIENIRYALQRGRPYGSEKWEAKTGAEFALESTLRNPWRPKKDS